jgi:hypothetical protein
MLEIERGARRFGLAAAALLSGAIIFWTALRSSLADWYVSETHADVIYTGIRHFGEFPFFSFLFNGGSYFLQDPQTNLFSPALPLILLAGPSVGLRLMECAWGVFGVYIFTVWMRRHVSAEAALLGAVASVLSLGVLWRVAFGNDMFLWHLGLPLLLWCVERVMNERTLRSALWFGLALGLLLLGPTFHSFIYLFLPALPLFVVLEWAFNRPTPKAFGKTLALFGVACAIAVVITSPKLVCWVRFPMQRPVKDHGVLSVMDALRGLFDYSLSLRSNVPTIRYSELGALKRDKWGMEECTAALPPLATLFALIGGAFGVGSRARRSLAVFALLLVAAGMALCCSWPVWAEFRALTGGGFRVPPRYLGMAAFGLAVLTALGADAVLSRFRRATLPCTLVALSLMFGSAIRWTVNAGNAPAELPGRAVSPRALNPLTVSRDERNEVARLGNFTELNRIDTKQRFILHGSGLSDGFLVVGNDFKEHLWSSRVPLPIVAQQTGQAEVTVEHLRIKLAHLEPHARIVLRALAPRYGMSVRTVPADAAVEVRGMKDGLLIQNRGEKPVARVIIRAELPISPLWFMASATCLLGVIAGLLLLERTQRALAAVEP